MINAHRTGAFISGLRKSKNWTQLDLAQKLQVTHQAVSQWEKGASFPDIGLLPQLGRLLGVSVDDLLNGEPQGRTSRTTRGAIVEELGRGNPREVARLVNDDPEGVDAMLAAAPLARPSQMDEVVSNLAGFSFTLQQIVDLAPFVTDAVLQSLLASTALKEIEGPVLIELAPFIGRDHVDHWAQRIVPGTLDLSTLDELAPFLGQETLSKMLFRLLDADHTLQREHLESMAPFLGRETLDALIGRLPEGPLPIDFVVELAPHVSSATLDRLVERLEDPAALGYHLDDLAPFLSRPSLKRIVTQRRGSLTTEALLDLAPHLDKATLADLLRQGTQNEVSSKR